MWTAGDLEKLNEGCLRGGKAGGKLRKMTVTGRMIPFLDKIIMVSTPLHKRNILMDYRTYNIAALEFINCNLGIPWTPAIEFETMTEYNGFLVEV